MKNTPKLLTLATALLALAVPSLSLAQTTTTTYTIGSSLCGVGSLSWIDCYNMPLAANGQASTAWIEMDYQAHAEDFIVGSLLGSYVTSNVQIVASIASQGRRYPTEVTATLTGVNFVTGAEDPNNTGRLDLIIHYTPCKVTRWTTGLCSNTNGGTITVTK